MFIKQVIRIKNIFLHLALQQVYCYCAVLILQYSAWKYLPLVFTDHGAVMAATLLNSPRATEVSVYVVRAFVRLREVLATNKELAKRLEELEQATQALASQHHALARNTRAQLKQVFDALRELMTPPEPPKRPIGFVPHKEKPKK